jgi:hypothetical protein
MGQTLVETQDTAAAGAWESVGIRFLGTEFQVPKNGLGIKGGSVNTLYHIQNPAVFLNEGADFLEGTFGWLDVFSRDIRGPGSPAPIATENRTISITVGLGGTAVTVDTGALTMNDLGARLYKLGKIDAYITEIGSDGTSCTISPGADAAMTAEAGVSVRWLSFFNRIVAQASITSGDKTLTLNGATPLANRFDANDVGRRIEIPGKLYSWIASVTNAFEAETYHNATATATDENLQVYQDGRAGSVIRITGDHNNINFIGGADEGLTWFIKNEVPTNEHPIYVLGSTVQIPSSLEDPCVLIFDSCKVRSGAVSDIAAVTANVSFINCNLSKIHMVPRLDGTTTISLTEFYAWKTRLGASLVPLRIGGIEDGQQRQTFGIQTRFFDPITGTVTTPTVIAANAGVTPGGPHRPAWAFGSLDATTGRFAHGYGVYRNYGEDESFGVDPTPLNTLYGGMGEMKSLSQAAPYIGFRFKGMPVLAQNFIKVAVAAALTSNQDNYPVNGGNDPSATVRWTADAARTVTGIAINTGAGYPFDVQEHTDIIGGSFPITFAHDVTSTAANRFYCPNNVDLVAYPGEEISRWYDLSVSRWRLRIRTDRAVERVVTADINYNTTVTPTNVTGLSFPILASGSYLITVRVFSTNPTKALSLQFAYSASTAGSTFKGTWRGSVPNMSVLNGARVTSLSTAFAPSTSFDAAGDCEYEFTGVYTAGSAAGTLTLQACQNASHASNTVLQRQSYMTVKRIG